jgi:hypothetical protein
MTAKNQFIAGMLLLSMHWMSCTPTLSASLDIANEKEGGPSGYDQKADLGANVALGWMMGLSGGGSGHNSVADHFPFVSEDSVWTSMAMPVDTHPTVGGQFAISPLVEFVQKGSKLNNISSRENYLEGVADIQYRYALSNEGTLYGGLGPFIAYGIGGKTGSGAYEASTFGGTDGYKRFDAGLNLRAGYAFASSLQFDLGYDLGLVDKSPDPSDYTSKSRNFSFSVGYSVDRIIGAFKRH